MGCTKQTQRCHSEPDLSGEESRFFIKIKSEISHPAVAGFEMTKNIL